MRFPATFYFLLVLIALARPAPAQVPPVPAQITTVAGNGVGDGLLATTATLDSPQGIALDAGGNLFIADTTHRRVRRVDAVTGVITTVAGTGTANVTPSGDGGPAIEASVQPTVLAFDSGGNLFVAEAGVKRIRRIEAGLDHRVTGAADETVSTVAGVASLGTPSGDGGPATSAGLGSALGIAFDPIGNLYLTDRHSIRRIDTGGDGAITGGLDASNEIITTVVGTGIQGFSGDGGPAFEAQLSSPRDVAVDAAGNLFVSDYGNNRIRCIATGADRSVTGQADEVITTWAFASSPWGVALDTEGNLFVGSSQPLVPRLDAATHLPTIVAGGGFGLGDGRATTVALSLPFHLAFGPGGDLYVTEVGRHRIRRILAGADGLVTAGADAQNETISTVAGNGTRGFGGDGGPATSALLQAPSAVALDAAGNLFIGDTGNRRIRMVDASGTITTVAGPGGSWFSPSGDGGPASQATVSAVMGMAFDKRGNLFLSSNPGGVRRIDAGADGVINGDLDEIITTVAGGGPALGDGGRATQTKLGRPRGVAFDRVGNLFIADDFPNSPGSFPRIWRIDAGSDGLVTGAADEIITTVAGSGSVTIGDGGPALEVRMSPLAIAFDEAGDLFLLEGSLPHVRRIEAGPDGLIAGGADMANEVISTVAGLGSSGGGFSGDGGPAVAASLRHPTALAFDGAGSLFVADFGNARVRRIDPGADGRITGAQDELISTVVGNGERLFSGDGGPPTAAGGDFSGLAVDAGGRLFLTDSSAARVRRADGVAAPSTSLPPAPPTLTSIAFDPAASITTLSGTATPGVTIQIYDASGNLLGEVTADDSTGAWTFTLGEDHRSDLTVMAIDAAGNASAPANLPPTADAGPDQVVEATGPDGAAVMLDGSGSTDPEGRPLALTWTGPFPQGGGTVTGVKPAVTLALGTHLVTLAADDGEGGTSADDVDVQVVDTTPPVVTATLVPVGEGDDHGDSDHDDRHEGRFRVVFSASDLVDPAPTIEAVLLVPGLPPIVVAKDQVVEIELEDASEPPEMEWKHRRLEVQGSAALLWVTATDASSNPGVAEALPLGLATDNDHEEDTDD